jgi:PEP-CTERM motif
MGQWYRVLGVSCAAVLTLFVANQAQAQLTVNGTGAADGFGLSTFVDGFTAGAGGQGPMGTATTTCGNALSGPLSPCHNILVTDVQNNTVYSFTDSNTLQHVGDALKVNSYGGAGYLGITNAFRGQTAEGIYGVNITVAGGSIDQFANDGSGASTFFSPMTSIGGVEPGGDGDGTTTNPLNGNIVVDAGNGIYEINQFAVATQIVNDPTHTGFNGDGIAESVDGSTVYLAERNAANENLDRIVAYSVATGLQIGAVTIPGADGIGVIQFDPSHPTLVGDLVVNTHSNSNLTTGGDLWLADSLLTTTTLIANGGSRGDFVGTDLNNGTLFVSQSDRVDRLSCGAGCVFEGGPAPSAVPEPSSLAIFAAGLAGLRWYRRRKAA